MGVGHRKQGSEEVLSLFTPFTLVSLRFLKCFFHELLCSLKINFKNVTVVFFLTSNNILKQDMNRKKTVRFIDFRISHLGSSVWLWFPSCALTESLILGMPLWLETAFCFAWIFEPIISGKNYISVILVWYNVVFFFFLFVKLGQNPLTTPNKNRPCKSKFLICC